MKLLQDIVPGSNKVLVVRNDLKMGKGKIAAQCRGVSLSIRRLKEIQCYRCVIHIKGLPCKGQRAKNNCRTLKGKRVAIPGKEEVKCKLFFFLCNL
ncbi:hypothetical protein BUALT_Bualt06G0125500 [Buddleja alternifolia]|uniref:Aminoacyl-tRNA hydrolase n=1 Tax=Buddleja alternifolia TaxID=168488 RepID=A0AAV6XQT0_9LAMI|nr:hypothetical protein BUALT_Bualt06G0125500 [Buddleja alternifolia]